MWSSFPPDQSSAEEDADESDDKESPTTKLAKLEARVKELTDRESELLEQVYAMKLENQVRNVKQQKNWHSFVLSQRRTFVKVFLM